MDVTLKAQPMKGKIVILELIKFEYFYSVKDLPKRTEKMNYRLGKVFADHISARTNIQNNA